MFFPLGSLESRGRGGQTDYYFTPVGAMIKESMTVLWENIHCCWVAKLYPTLRPHGGQHAMLASLSFTISQVCSISCPLGWWCHPAVSSSVTPFSSSPQSFQKSVSFPVSQLLASGGRSIDHFSISPSSEYSGLISFWIDWFDLLAL